MLSIEELKNYGADVETGLKRCVNKESLYLRLVKTVPAHDGFSKLKEAIAANDLEAGFQAAHGLKGVCANLALTPISKPVEAITELLRAKESADYAPLLKEIEDARSALEAICKD
ncbi:MAG: Hpt domain-containing protein [Bacilli bacterium]|nr:Hpt domain-containing protein [Bacilli bacterium]